MYWLQVAMFVLSGITLGGMVEGMVVGFRENNGVVAFFLGAIGIVLCGCVMLGATCFRVSLTRPAYDECVDTK